MLGRYGLKYSVNEEMHNGQIQHSRFGSKNTIRRLDPARAYKGFVISKQISIYPVKERKLFK